MKNLILIFFTVIICSPSLSRGDFLDELSQRSFRYFVEHSHPKTGLVLDRAPNDGSVPPKNRRAVANIAATGFGLTAYCIAAERGWIKRATARAQILKTLRFLSTSKNRVNGWFYHWVDARSGKRIWKSEVSSIDTGFLLAGVLMARNYFSTDAEITRLSTQIYEAVDFRWMLAGHPTLLSHGWVPEKGFLSFRWDAYSEHLLLYLLAIGSPTHAIPAKSWYAWERKPVTYKDITYVQSTAPLFIHQYSHAWIDFRGLREDFGVGIDWFQNSIDAVRAHREFCMDLSSEFQSYSPSMWGITASDSAQGYIAWGGPPKDLSIDGTLVPSALSGSLMFVGLLAEEPLRQMKINFGLLTYGRYGFANAFNPLTGWVAEDVIGIDVGITLLSIENFKRNLVWKWFSQDPDIKNAISRSGLAQPPL